MHEKRGEADRGQIMKGLECQDKEFILKATGNP